jgi:5-methylcytosine-specific restriction endonuclease McrA
MSALRPTGSTRAWRRIRLYVLDRDGWRCQLPADDRPGPCLDLAEHVDHITSRAEGGTDDPANLRAACAFHNLRRGTGRPTSPQLRQPCPRRWSW